MYYSPKEITNEPTYGFCVTVDCKATFDYESIFKYKTGIRRIPCSSGSKTGLLKQ